VLRKLFPHVDEQTLRLNLQRLRTKRATSVTTSSLGRLFDAVAALLGLCDANTTDGQAPMAVEAAAETAAREGDAGTKLSWNLIEPDDPDVPLQIDLQPMIQQLAHHRLAGLDPGPAALGFHQALAEMLAEAGAMVAKSRRITRIVLSGGCFANRRLLKSLHRALRKRELEVYHHHLVPPGDGGIALGQAAVAAAQIEQE
jgi:hydrogenase maturation protein HypF